MLSPTAPPAARSPASLIFELGAATVSGPLPDAGITAICHDSREVAPGSAFVAVPGGRMDGHAFLRHALASGARMLVVQEDHRGIWAGLAESGATLVSVPDTRMALGLLASAFYGHPSRRLTVVGVTGTDGKTTTAFLTAGVLAAGGHTPALLSTAGTQVAGEFTPNRGHLTTPDPVAVQRFLATARDTGADCAIVEATSQGLDQGRLVGTEVDIAVLTNLGTDHLDYHGSPAAYRRAKARLFEMLDSSRTKGTGKAAVLNADDPAAEALASWTTAGRIYYGITQNGSQVRADHLLHTGWASAYRLRTGDGAVPVRLALPGRFNVSNSLAAAAAGVALGLDLDQIRRGLAAVRQVPGRMQRIEAGQDATVVVDYAHNAHELSQALSFLRTTTPGRVIAVFGCAGNRDRSRRPQMGRVAGQLADYAVLTGDDSWQEDTESIMDEVAGGLAEAGRHAGQDYARRPDRREAIGLALAMARTGDTVLVAGMGHEQAMMVAGQARPWDDRLVIEELLAGGTGTRAEPVRPG